MRRAWRELAGRPGADGFAAIVRQCLMAAGLFFDLDDILSAKESAVVAYELVELLGGVR